MLSILTISIFSSIIGILWLSIPIFVRLIVDKIIIPNSFENLALLSAIILGIILIAGILDLRVVTFINRNSINSRNDYSSMNMGASPNSRIHFLSYKIAFEFPRAILSILLISVISLNLALVICLLSSILYLIYYLLLMRQIDSSVYHSLEMQNLLPTVFPISARLVFTIIIVSTFLWSSYLVITADITLGALIAACAIAIQFNLSISSIINYLAYIRNESSLN